MQSARCPVCPWTVPSSTSCLGPTDSSLRPPTSDSCWSSSDWLLNPGAPHWFGAKRCPQNPLCYIVHSVVLVSMVLWLNPVGSSLSCNCYLLLSIFSACETVWFESPVGSTPTHPNSPHPRLHACLLPSPLAATDWVRLMSLWYSNRLPAVELSPVHQGWLVVIILFAL